MDDVYGDIQEDNRIDRMAPLRPRNRKPPTSFKKRQRRISDYAQNVGPNLQDGPSPSPRPTSKRRKGSFHQRHHKPRRKRSQNARAPSLGVLDAPGYRTLPRSKQPQFLRVAANHARSRSTGARQSPSRKFLQLASHADTRDVNRELTIWRRGLLGQNADSSLQVTNRKAQQERDRAKNCSFGRRRNRSLTLGNEETRVPAVRSLKRPRKADQNCLVSYQDEFPPTDIGRHPNRSQPSSNGVTAAVRGWPIALTPAPVRSLGLVQMRHPNVSGRRSLLVSTANLGQPRDAQLEDLIPNPRDSTAAAFHRRFAARPPSPPQLSRDQARNAERPDPSSRDSETHIAVKDLAKPAASRRIRKRVPRFANALEINPALSSDIEEETVDADAEHVTSLSGVVLAGLGSPEFPISNNFGIHPLADGTCFHETTFLGRGLLLQAIHKPADHLRGLKPQFTKSTIVYRPSAAENPFEWRGWDERVDREVSAWFVELGNCLQETQFSGTPQTVRRTILAATASFTSYLASQAILSSRSGFVAWLENAMTDLQKTISLAATLIDSSYALASADLLRVSNSLLVVLLQFDGLSTSASTDKALQGELCRAFKSLAHATLGLIFRESRFGSVLASLSSDGEACIIRDQYPEVDALVIINAVAKHAILRIDIWDLISEVLQSFIGTVPENLVTFQDYDRWWRAIFSALPFLEIDVLGVLRRGSGSTGWDLVQRLVIRFMSLYMSRRHQSGYSTKKYGRMLIHRCLQLVQVWGWQGGHSVIGIFFDAYSNGDLTELFGETPQQHFVVPFNLSADTRLHIREADSGFHAFLGLVLQTILGTGRTDADPKLAKRVLRSLSARLVSPKSILFPRNERPNQHDLNALRNRFDLLAVLHSAMPKDMKPQLRMFQSLVDFRKSHREACKVALGCWSGLAQRHIHNGEMTNYAAPASSAEKDEGSLFLKKWHDSLAMDLLAEYATTGHEVPGFERQAHNDNNAHFVYSDKRRLIREIILDSLSAYEAILELCRNSKQATELFNQKLLGEILRLSDPGDTVSNPLVSAALQVVRVYIRKVLEKEDTSTEDDSQDYGSWDHFDEMVVDDRAKGNCTTKDHSGPLHEVLSLMRRYLSNVFGSDTIPDHTILKATTDCWFEVADALVRTQTRSWDDFVGQYASDSWESLRNTQQWQQYRVYFLAKIVDTNYAFYEDNRLHVLTLWLSALCLPKQCLYWEHLLTSVILFHDSDNELLFNHPFVVRSETGNRLDISVWDLHKRRSSMFYILVRNMHRLLTTPTLSSQSTTPYSKSDFTTILKSIEAAMKHAYQDLESDQEAQSEYRLFINTVIQQMQLYVVDFYKIDSFFTDPAITSTEAYAITAALKRYSLTIHTTGITKAMVLFLYNASERGAINNTQDNFVAQLCDAFLGLSQEAIERTENHDSDAALLTLFLQNVFPAYLAHAFSPPGNVLATPMIRALRHIYQNLRCRADMWNPCTLGCLVKATEWLLDSTIDAFGNCSPADILASTDHLDNFDNLVLLIHAAMLRMYEAAEAFPEDIDPGDLIELFILLKDKITAVERPTCAEEEILLAVESDENLLNHRRNEDSMMKKYADTELKLALERTWRKDRYGGWEIVGRVAPKTVKASRTPGSAAGDDQLHHHEHKQRMTCLVREFVHAFISLPWWE
jgi:Mus7/MMS22 family